ncbi:MAG TPA: 16S rRNA (guanine(527)-N(7))-methyltransferase RsmG [Hellea balneolensis]|uniref:Ribosomal RNA small subunit methyltransferase G n=1 Tax=Hellea balneolensis TaxID=287478 RepID=A0A7C5R133_9PROT|nr:16S rRNA (guanine(527)-N(7))-methyltransferase RsmG [Hellea balneolensis]
MPDLPKNAQDFQALSGVSRETLAAYELWYKLLCQWNAKINLVAPSSLSRFWSRHVLDSHQITALIPKPAQTVLDMGAGAGFPGLALAITSPTPSRTVHLVETNGKKCNFLRAVIRALKVPAVVKQARIETIETQVYDIITARAFASLVDLLNYSERFWGEHTLGLFPKGEHWQDELKAAQARFTFDVEDTPSLTNPDARILGIRHLKRK